jgi:hypothetical protein
MDGFDAKNHLNDLHREAEQRRIARLVKEGFEAEQKKQQHPSLIEASFRLIAGGFAR